MEILNLQLHCRVSHANFEALGGGFSLDHRFHILEIILRDLATRSTVALATTESNDPDPSWLTNTNPQPYEELPLELTIPLPPSPALSECGKRDSATSQDGSQSRELHTLARYQAEIHQQQETFAGVHEEPRDITPMTDPVAEMLSPFPDHSGQNIETEETPSDLPANHLTSTTISSLLKSLEDEQYEVNETAIVKNSFHEMIRDIGRSRRSFRTLQRRYRSMAHSFRNQDQNGFLTHFEACQEHLSQSAKHVGPDQLSDSNAYNSDNLLRTLQPEHRSTLLGFLDKIRTDEQFLSARLLSLPPQELSTWPSSGSSSSTDNSLFSRHVATFNNSSKDQYLLSGTRSAPTPTLETSNVYHIIMYNIFDDSSHSERKLRRGVWSSACANLLTKGKGGGEDFLFTVLDSFAMSEGWSLRSRLEAYLLEILQDGSFLLESAPAPSMDFSQPIEIQNASQATASSEFFDTSIRKLFRVLSINSSVYGVPQPALDFAREVLNRLPNSKLRSRTRTLVASRWFLSSFLSRILIYPETVGLLLGHHIGEAPRRIILKSLAVRLQQQVVDISAPWKSDYTVAPDVKIHVDSIIGLFETPSIGRGLKPETETLDPELGVRCFQLRCDELIDLVDFFFPESSASPVPQGKAPGYASIAPSLTGASTTTNESTEIPSLTPSSVAPSVSGTSMTSLTRTNEDPQSETEASPTTDDREQKISVGGLDLLTSDKGVAPVVEALHDLKSLVDRRVTFFPQHRYSLWFTLYIASQESDTNSVLETWPQSETGITSICETQKDSQALQDDVQILKGALVQLFDLEKRSGGLPWNPNDRTQMDSATALTIAFEERMRYSQSSFDYQAAHFWWRAAMVLQGLVSGSHGQWRTMTALSIIEKESKNRSAGSRDSRSQLKEGLRHLQVTLRQLQTSLATTKQDIYELRTKMWYVTDVKHSSPYEDALRVSQAIHSMISNRGASKPTGVTSWARQRLRSGFGYPRAESQVYEAMTASREHGGPPKLADDQVELTSRWLTKNSIENFCRGEELIHRFCFEIRKCGNKIAGPSMIDSPVLWSSKLFYQEKLHFDRHRLNSTNSSSGSSGQTLSTTNGIPGLMKGGFTLQTSEVANFHPRSTLSEQSHRATGSSARDYTTVAQVLHPNSASDIAHKSRSEQFPATMRNVLNGQNTALAQFLDTLRSSLKSLLLSDLGYSLWSRGSETDRWIWSRVDDAPANSFDILPRPQNKNFNIHSGGASVSDTLSDSTITASIHAEQSTVSHESTLRISSSSQKEQEPVMMSPESSGPLKMTMAAPVQFPFQSMYTEILTRFSATASPYKKLDLLYELEILISQSFVQAHTLTSNRRSSSQVHSAIDRNALLARSPTVPRTKATSLEEVMANCSERRLGTLRSSPSNTDRKPYVREVFVDAAQSSSAFGTDEVIHVMLFLFQDSSTRPPTLFRDLQMIAAFVPSEILDQTPKGKAFWDASIAALAFKEDVCESLIKQANEITNFHLANTKEIEGDQISQVPSSLAGTSLTDAAKLWIIVAKEGSPVAARELGLLYLTHPDVLPRVTLPLSKPRDVFKSAMHPQDRNNHDTKGLDPLTFAVVYHWMELAANGGDKDAKDFLKGVGDLNAGK